MSAEIDEIVGFEEPGDEIDRLAYLVIGAAIEVHKRLGPGHSESIYEEALCVELELRGISFERQKVYQVRYKDRVVGTGRLDVLVGGKLVVEVKACEELKPLFISQTVSYLRANEMRLGLLINFNVKRLKEGVRRVANTTA